MKRTFRFDAGMDISVTIRVDLAVLTHAMAAEINNFWSFSDEVLDASDNDVIIAAARRAATRLVYSLIDGCNADGAVAELCQQEGWPPREQLGMSIVDFEIPYIETLSIEFTELGETA